MTVRVRRLLVFSGIPALLVAIADQLAKTWAIGALRRSRRSITVVEGFFDFRYSENTGSAFGLFQGKGDVLTVIGLGALAFVAYLAWKNPDARRKSLVALGLIAGGAVGNLYDRLARGSVVDFIVWHLRDTFVWPAFNVADAALVAGVAMILIWPEKQPEP
ncbi:MAG: signal peptidase II [Myxococcota bacterium]